MRNMKFGKRAPLALSAVSLAAALALGVAAPQAMALAIPKVAPVDRGAASPTQLPHLVPRPGAAQPDALDAFVDSVGDPASANFRKFITAGAIRRRRYGQPPAAVAQVVAYLQAQGFTIDPGPRQQPADHVKGTNAQIAATFGTPIHN